MLREHCGHLCVDDRGARFGQGYRQRLEFKQPGDSVLQWVAGRDDTLINRGENALDFIFASPAEQDAAFEFLHQQLIRRWHGKTQKIKLVRGVRDKQRHGKRAPELVDEIELGQTRYDGWRAPNKIAFYKDRFSRVTGELNCLHLEWHLNGLAACQAAGIKSGEDLVTFNHRQFWKERMRLVDVDPERLGRLIRNRAGGTRSRTAEIGKGNRMTSDDKRNGWTVLQAYPTMQDLMDQFGSNLRLRSILHVMPNDPLNRPGFTGGHFV